MAKDSEWLNTAKNLAGLALLLTVGTHPVESANATISLVTPEPDCSETMPQNNDYGAIIVIAGGAFTDEWGNIQANDFHRERLKAAADLVAAGFSDNVVIVDGGNGPILQSNGFLLNKYVEDIALGKKITFSVDHLPNSENSAENVFDIEDYMTTNGITKAVVVTDGFHAKRFRLLLENNRMKTVHVEPTECIVELFRPEDLPYFEERAESGSLESLEQKEMFETFMLIFDIHGQLTIELKPVETFVRSKIDATKLFFEDITSGK